MIIGIFEYPLQWIKGLLRPLMMICFLYYKMLTFIGQANLSNNKFKIPLRLENVVVL